LRIRFTPFDSPVRAVAPDTPKLSLYGKEKAVT